MDSEDDVFMYSDDGSDDGGVQDFEEVDTVTQSHREQQKENYRVLNEEDIRRRQEHDIAEISTVLSIPRASASLLLRHYKWSVAELQDAWFADEGKVRENVGYLEKPVGQFHDDWFHGPGKPGKGVGSSGKPVDQSAAKGKKPKLTCGICFESYFRDRMNAAACGHYFCMACWKSYVSMSINDGIGCLMLRCPEPSCGVSVDEDMILLLVSKEDNARYSRYLLQSYTEHKKNIKWCPSPGCDYAIEFDIGSEYCDVICNCEHCFCWKCTEENHRPVDCDTVAKWIHKNNDESENVNWILANSKPCPQCKKPIEKNQGCMHMTCRPPCKHEFCWLCLAPWRNHNNACNRYRSEKNDEVPDETEVKRRRAKASIERYTHYYERWAANNKSMGKAAEDFKLMETVNIAILSKKLSLPETDFKFITEAWQQIIDCRRVLKWTYAYAYYLLEHEHEKRNFFEYLQGDAESGLERLHQCAEKELNDYLSNNGIPSRPFNEFRAKLAGLTSVTRTYFDNLVRALENGLSDVKSQGESSRKTKSSKHSKSGTKKVVSRSPDPIPTNQAWTCEFCSSENEGSDSVCQACTL